MDTPPEATDRHRPTGTPPDAATPLVGQHEPPWRVLLRYIRPHRHILLVGALLSLATGAAALALPLVARELIDRLSGNEGIAGLLAVMTVLVIANAVIGALGTYVLHRSAESVVLTARQSLTSHLLRLKVSALDRGEPGDLMARVTSDTTLLRAMTTESLIGMATGGLLLVGTLVMMALVDVVLLLVTLAVMALAGAAIGTVLPRIRRATKHAQESVGLIGAALERVLGALRTVKAAVAERREERVVHAAARDSWRENIRAALWSAVASHTAGLSTQVVFITVLGAGGARVATGAIDVGSLVAFLLYVFYLMTPLQQVVTAVSRYHVGAAAILRIQEAHALPVEPVAPTADDAGPTAATGAALPAQGAGATTGDPTGDATTAGDAGASPAAGPVPAALAFEDVRFRYAPDLPDVHHGVTFTIPPRGMTALVGPSGAGKTTVLSLTERFHDPVGGRILLDGVSVDGWELSALRSSIGYVEQDAPVLSGTLRENLLIGSARVDQRFLTDTLRTARLEELVARLPDGLDTVVGHRGTRLSGGERQRVAIARALLRQPRLLLLDEATSQLDAVNEAALRDAIAEAARTTTVIVVAHRLSTVVMADQIVVMERGRVRAQGKHTELLDSDQLYTELAATQFLTRQ